jgi:hypothetical protein
MKRLILGLFLVMAFSTLAWGQTPPTPSGQGGMMPQGMMMMCPMMQQMMKQQAQTKDMVLLMKNLVRIQEKVLAGAGEPEKTKLLSELAEMGKKLEGMTAPPGPMMMQMPCMKGMMGGQQPDAGAREAPQQATPHKH